jgi:galactonate dehydratase
VIVRLKADKGLTGLGEASHGAPGRSDEPTCSALQEFFGLVKDESPFAVERFRERAWLKAKTGGRVTATAFSAIEQAMWDLAGKALDVPVHELLGGKLRDSLEVYANINRATEGERSPEAFGQNARRAVEQGFHAVKAAPFDGFPKPGSPRMEMEKAADLGIAAMEAIRKAVGPSVKVLVDCHSYFDRALAIEVARRLEPVSLYWYEEPVQPETRLEDLAAIGRAVKQPLAGGEVSFGVEGFAPLVRSRALQFIMPDVKHCGGILEAKNIAVLAAVDGVAVSPHNPSGPVATAASVQASAGMRNFALLEHAWGEVPWSKDLVTPPEEIRDGAIRVPARPGLGIELNEKILMQHT